MNNHHHQRPAKHLIQVHSNNPGGSKSKKRKRSTEDDSGISSCLEVDTAKAIKLSLPPEFPSLLIRIRQSNISGEFWLGLPKKFSKLHLSRKDTTILLEDEQGIEFEAKYCYRRKKVGLLTGWKEFTKAHDLVVGDVVVLQTLCPTKFKVYIVKSNEGHKAIKSKEAFPWISSKEVGESSNSASLKFSCEICVEQKHVDDSFQVQACTHSYCTDCITQYIISKLDQNITWVKCPVENCEGFLETEHCRSILPNHIYEKWGKARCEALIPAAEKLYCPFKDCSAILIKEGNVVRELECPHCFRLFCAQCESPWHAEMDCTEFQKLNKDEREREDIMLIKLAKKEKWKRCPSCRFYVKKKNGCEIIRCRCKVKFCYSCGKEMNSSHYCNCFGS